MLPTPWLIRYDSFMVTYLLIVSTVSLLCWCGRLALDKSVLENEIENQKRLASEPKALSHPFREMEETEEAFFLPLSAYTGSWNRIEVKDGRVYLVVIDPIGREIYRAALSDDEARKLQRVMEPFRRPLPPPTSLPSSGQIVKK